MRQIFLLIVDIDEICWEFLLDVTDRQNWTMIWYLVTIRDALALITLTDMATSSHTNSKYIGAHAWIPYTSIEADCSYMPVYSVAITIDHYLNIYIHQTNLKQFKITLDTHWQFSIFFLNRGLLVKTVNHFQGNKNGHLKICRLPFNRLLQTPVLWKMMITTRT